MGRITVKERYARCIEWFEATNPSPVTELHYKSHYQLLVAVILSAQCTDKRVNMITPALFEAYPTVESMAEASQEEIFNYIKSCSYPNNKARSLAQAARMIVNEYAGEIPGEMEQLLRIPGVGRKTANVMLSVAFDKAAMAVDTHVFRVADRIGLTTGCTTPLAVEKGLMKNLPTELVPKAHHWLILHGRYICKARRPDCLNCGLRDVCRHYNRNNKTTR